ncbi:hypothetical protein C8J57DRAFT_1729293 [Mycena rebaudengoi]|nr:hypothetical protein C8J57DRAFT_1729293 [Mycena rebaudengoi]
MSDPSLPYEIERHIFELTARAHPKCAMELALVSRYVQAWVEAIIYEIIVLEASSPPQALFWRTVSSRPPAFFAKNVRSLHLTTGVSDRDARRIISVCTEISSLTYWAGNMPNGENLFSLLPSTLRRLSINAPTLWSPHKSAPDLTRTIFSRLTHLEVVNPHRLFDWFPVISEALPSLTHLAFGDVAGTQAADMLSLFRVALACEAPRLEMLVAVSRDEYFVSELAKIDDERLVCLPSYHRPLTPKEYWRNVARKEIEFWISAAQ